MKIERFTFGPFETNTYVVCDKNGNVLLIDPACFGKREQQEVYECVEKLRTDNRQPITIIATHGHLDHLWGAKWATEKWGVPVLIDEADIPMAQAMQQQYDMFGFPAKAESFEIKPLSQSSSFAFQLIHTPGHTQGSVCLYFPEDKVLFSGDTLFQMGYGRTVLPGGNYSQLIESLEKLWTLTADVKVYPGHGESTTIGAEKR